MPNGSFDKLLKRFQLSESGISTVLGAIVVIFVGILIYNYFRGVGKPPAESPAPELKLGEEQGVTIAELPTTHTVQGGEHLWQIAEKYYGSGYNWVDIAQENKLANANFLIVGRQLAIPKAEPRKSTITQAPGSTISGETYTVVKGDYLWKIALRAYGDGYKWPEIAEANSLKNPNLIHPGNVLKLPR